MGELRNISFEEEPADIKEKVTGYWIKRADSFFDIRYRELKSNKAERWLHEMEALLPHDKKLNILDIGCGAGFSRVEIDIDFGNRIFKEQDEFYIPDRMFRIAAFKD